MSCWALDRDYIESVDQFGEELNLNNEESPDPRTQYISLFITSSLNSLSNYFIVFSTQVLNIFCHIYPHLKNIFKGDYQIYFLKFHFLIISCWHIEIQMIFFILSFYPATLLKHLKINFLGFFYIESDVAFEHSCRFFVNALY